MQTSKYSTVYYCMCIKCLLFSYQAGKQYTLSPIVHNVLFGQFVHTLYELPTPGYITCIRLQYILLCIPVRGEIKGAAVCLYPVDTQLGSIRLYRHLFTGLID